LILPLVLLSAVCAAAGTIGQIDFDPSALPAAFPGAREASDAALTSELRRRLPMDMSVVASQRIIVAAPAPEQETRVTGRRIAGYETQIRRRHFPDVAARRIVVVLGGDESNVRGLAKALYPAVDVARVPDPGFYHSEDGLILAKASDGDRAVLNGLMRALVQDDNPNAPHWFIEAMATLFESNERSADGLVPTLDERMALIATDEDLDYDVFAGICDCSALGTIHDAPAGARCLGAGSAGVEDVCRATRAGLLEIRWWGFMTPPTRSQGRPASTRRLDLCSTLPIGL
jgi:hypothetical protein